MGIRYTCKFIAVLYFLLICLKSIHTTEFVPVLIWDSSSDSNAQKEIPALATVSADEFKDIVMQRLQRKSVVVIFTEENLSIEDFSWQDEEGDGAFPNLERISKNSEGLIYLPFVHMPLHAFHHHTPIQGQEWYHFKLGIDNEINNAEVLNKTLLYLTLDDAKSNEDRPDLLKRHDLLIAKFYKMLVEQHGNVLALYTAHHSSWSGEETMTKRVRHLLSVPERDEREEASEPPYSNNNTLLYVTNITLCLSKDTCHELTRPTTSGSEDTLILDYTVGTESITLGFYFSRTESGYWSLEKVNASANNDNIEFTVNGIEAPLKFSYHCNQGFNFLGKDDTFLASTEKFQIQPYIEEERFGSSYDCVYFFTVPIWSGLFVCTIFAIIMAFGLGMIMDIKTMDRFDDPKGKTITVNVAE